MTADRTNPLRGLRATLMGLVLLLSCRRRGWPCATVWRCGPTPGTRPGTRPGGKPRSAPKTWPSGKKSTMTPCAAWSRRWPQQPSCASSIPRAAPSFSRNARPGRARAWPIFWPFRPQGSPSVRLCPRQGTFTAKYATIAGKAHRPLQPFLIISQLLMQVGRVWAEPRDRPWQPAMHFPYCWAQDSCEYDGDMS